MDHSALPRSATPTLTRLTALASPDHGELAVREAKRRSRDGDESWGDWLARLQDGKAIIVRLLTRVEFELEAQTDTVEVTNHGVWIDRDVHLPKVEEQVREIAYKDVRPLHDALRSRGVDVAPAELEAMFFHVELSAELVAVLRRSGRALGQRALKDRS